MSVMQSALIICLTYRSEGALRLTLRTIVSTRWKLRPEPRPSQLPKSSASMMLNVSTAMSPSICPPSSIRRLLYGYDAACRTTIAMSPCHTESGALNLNNNESPYFQQLLSTALNWPVSSV